MDKFYYSSTDNIVKNYFIASNFAKIRFLLFIKAKSSLNLTAFSLGVSYVLYSPLIHRHPSFKAAFIIYHLKILLSTLDSSFFFRKQHLLFYIIYI